MTTPDDHGPQRPRRFTDQRGIALQTVIIMVVLLAIAGGVAAVLLNRGSEASNQLENQSVSVAPYKYTNKKLCESAGLDWRSASDTAVTEAVDQDWNGDGTVKGPIPDDSCYDKP